MKIKLHGNQRELFLCLTLGNFQTQESIRFYAFMLEFIWGWGG